MSNLIRGISENGGVVFCGVDSTEIVRTAEKLHTTSATCSAASPTAPAPPWISSFSPGSIRPSSSSA